MYRIHIVEQDADTNQLEYGFVSFYSGVAAFRAQRELNGNLNIGGRRVKVQFSDRIKPTAPSLLHSSRCQELANYYLGFQGWSSRIASMETVPTSEGSVCYHCQVELQIAVCHGVCQGSGIGEVPHVPTGSIVEKVLAVGAAKKVAFSQALAAAFSRVILCILPSGKVGAHVVPSCNLLYNPSHDPSCDKLETVGEDES